MAGILLAAAALAAAGADWSAAEVRVEWKGGTRDTIIVENSAWRCDGEICRGRVIDKPLLRHRACRAIARFAGGVTRFATATTELDSQELERCNGGR